MTTTTVEEVMRTLYEQLSTQPYRPRSSWTTSAYRPDPLLARPAAKFEPDPLYTASELLVGPAAKVYTPTKQQPK